jgi:hypothetical protein
LRLAANGMKETEWTWARELLDAQAKAQQLFQEVETRGLVRSGITEG